MLSVTRETLTIKDVLQIPTIVTFCFPTFVPNQLWLQENALDPPSRSMYLTTNDPGPSIPSCVMIQCLTTPLLIGSRRKALPEDDDDVLTEPDEDLPELYVQHNTLPSSIQDLYF